LGLRIYLEIGVQMIKESGVSGGIVGLVARHRETVGADNGPVFVWTPEGNDTATDSFGVFMPYNWSEVHFGL